MIDFSFESWFFGGSKAGNGKETPRGDFPEAFFDGTTFGWMHGCILLDMTTTTGRRFCVCNPLCSTSFIFLLSFFLFLSCSSDDGRVDRVADAAGDMARFFSERRRKRHSGHAPTAYFVHRERERDHLLVFCF